MRLSARFISVPFLFTIFYLIFAILSFAQTPTPTSRVDLANALGTGDNDHDGTADDLTVSGSVSANPIKANLSQTASAGQKAISIGAASGFNQKDEVAIIQMTGTNAGTWETAYVLDTRPKGRLLLNRTLTNTYTVDASAKAQVIRIPHYRNVRVQSGGVLTVDPWDGSKGGVMFLRVQNNLDVANNGKIDVSSKGFRGGVGSPAGGCPEANSPLYCPLGTSCWDIQRRDEATIYECCTTENSSRTACGVVLSRTDSEGPQERGGLAGGAGRNGWTGGGTVQRGSGWSSGTGDGGAGGSAGGGGGGGSLTANGTRGSDGGGGSPGGRVYPSGDCSGRSTGSQYTETGLEWISTRERSYDSCSSNDYICTDYFDSRNGNYLGFVSYHNDKGCHSESSESYSGGYPNVTRPGGAGGDFGATTVLSGSKILLGSGGGAGGIGSIGGTGGSTTKGPAGARGGGSNGGAGAGAIVIFAKDISVSGEVLASGGVGSQGTPGGPGEPGSVGGTTGAYSGGGGGGGAGGGGGGGASGGVIRFYGEDIDLGNNKVRVNGGTGVNGGSGNSGGGGYSQAGSGGSGGSGSLGGNGSNGAIFATYTRSLSGNTNPAANAQIGSVTPFSGIVPTPTPTPTPTPDPAFNNLAAYWKMNETSGNTVADSIASNNGTANGTTIVSGVLGQARNFDGYDDAVVVPHSSSLEGMSRLTISAWIKPSTIQYIGYIITKATIGAVIEPKNNPYSISRRASEIDALIGNGTTFRGVTGRTRLSADRLYHLVMTYDGTTLKLYVNGAEDASTPANIGALTSSAERLYMGKSASAFYGAGIYPFGGIIDEVGIWNRALTREEISRLYNGGNGLSP